MAILSPLQGVNTLRPRRNEQHFADDIFKRIFFNENVWISIKISLKFVLKGPINNIPPLFQIMAWRRSGDKPLSEPMMVSLPTHICVIRPQWVNAPTHVWLTISRKVNYLGIYKGWSFFVHGWYSLVIEKQFYGIHRDIGTKPLTVRSIVTYRQWGAN